LSAKQAQKAAWVLTLIEEMDHVPVHYFQKKTKKTPRQAIKTAEERKSDYFRRKRK
jgi:phage-related protein